MKRNFLKRIGAVALAVAVSLTMGVTSFAGSATPSGATPGSDGTVTTDNNTVSIAKELIFVNDESTNVREPNITYNYTLAAVTGVSGATVTDSTGMSGTVKDGIANAISNTTDTVVFADTNAVSAGPNGTSLKRYANFTFDPREFTAPGIYRYSITEGIASGSNTKAQAGITEAATYVAGRYLDVYVKKNETSLEIYGYVLYEDSSASAKNDSFDGTEGETVNLDKKSQGYVNKSTTAGSQEDVDVYETENLVITKKTTGAMADTSHSFPLSIALTNPQGVNTAKVGVAAADGGTVSVTGTDDAGDYAAVGTITGSVKDGSSITITGAPVNSTVAVTEQNDSGDAYKVKAGKTEGAADILTEAIVAAGGTSGAMEVTLDGKANIYITNTLDEISPTNVVMRFAPFLFIFGAAILLLVVMRRRKTQDAE